MATDDNLRNIMSGGPSIIRRLTSEKSNTELTNSLRANFQTAQASLPATQWEAKHASSDTTTVLNAKRTNYQEWTTQEGSMLFVPAANFTSSGLAEERSQYDITVKLFFLPSTRVPLRCTHAAEAISLVLRELHVPSIDLLVVSFPGISFDADDDDDEGIDGPEKQDIPPLDDMIQTWRTLEDLLQAGTVAQLGLAEFGSERLKSFLPKTRMRPSVDQINVRDCCVVPKSLILYAKAEKIELLTHSDCTNILSADTVRELLGTGPNGAGVLAEPTDDSTGLRGEVEPQWVVKYTAVVRDRGVIENKGYFAMADISS